MDRNGEDTLRPLAANMDHYYEQLVSQYRQQLCVFVSRRLGWSGDAEDIVQEALVRAYMALARYSLQQRENLKVRGWLYKITWNVYCNYITRSKHIGVVSLDNLEEHELPEWEDEREGQPEMIFEQMERRQELETLVATLPSHYSVVVSLYYFEDLSHQEIADILNKPIGTIKMYVHRGVRLLRKALATEMHEVK